MTTVNLPEGFAALHSVQGNNNNNVKATLKKAQHTACKRVTSGCVHTNTFSFENSSFSLRFGLKSTLRLKETQRFQNTPQSGYI